MPDCSLVKLSAPTLADRDTRVAMGISRSSDASSSQALASMLTFGIMVYVVIVGAGRTCVTGEEGFDVV